VFHGDFLFWKDVGDLLVRPHIKIYFDKPGDRERRVRSADLWLLTDPTILPIYITIISGPVARCHHVYTVFVFILPVTEKTHKSVSQIL
jgi:hypothetical protein